MVESSAETVPATPVAASPKKKKTAAKAKPTATKTLSHPPTATMVNSAIKTLNERGGSSLQAIKKSISGTYKVDAEKFAPFIKKYLKSAVEKGALIQTKGKGASGSFKLAVKPKAEGKKKSAPKKKPVAPKKEKSAEAKPKKAKASPKKPASTTKKAAKPKVASKPKPSTPKKAPSKAKATKATPSKKPKTPKPKKVAAKKPAKKTITKK